MHSLPFSSVVQTVAYNTIRHCRGPHLMMEIMEHGSMHRLQWHIAWPLCTPEHAVCYWEVYNFHEVKKQQTHSLRVGHCVCHWWGIGSVYVQLVCVLFKCFHFLSDNLFKFPSLCIFLIYLFIFFGIMKNIFKQNYYNRQ